MTTIGPAVAGSWYPADSGVLARTVDQLLAAAAPGTGTAAIAPHAGFAYSGPLAAAAVRSVAHGRVRRVVLLGPSHYFGFSGAAVPGAARALRTPLGDCHVDREAVASLREQAGFLADDRFFEPEHALEAELPFLQRALGVPFSVVPILMGGGATRDDAGRVAAAITPWLDVDTRVVVSSDFTHFGPRFGYVPFEDGVPDGIHRLDHGALDAIAAGDPSEFGSYVDRTGATICGRRAIDVLLRLACGASGGTLLGYDTSGRMTGSWDHSVSYAAVVFPPKDTTA
jgi:AmmeMemoRadiSam system protein B